jgi:hypothetical protein
MTNNLFKGFHDYIKSFYGSGGIYDYDFSDDEIQQGIRLRLETRKDFEFQGDTADREITRDIILNLRQGAHYE